MKKILLYCFIFLTTGLLFTACQRELFFDTVNAKGALIKDANNNCAPFTVNGSYIRGIALDATNYIDVQINITQIGNYVIKTNTTNGYYFYDSSSVAILGLNTFRLKAIGTPLAANFDNFIVSFDGSTCSLTNIVTASGAVNTAEYTLNGTPNACAGAAQTLNFFAGIPTVTALNKDTIYVNVTRVGSYTITASTIPSNGLTFTKSGTFTTIGTNQQVILDAVGTPSTAGTIPYTINTTTPASTCAFNLIVGGAATYTLNCGNYGFTGVYQQGTPIPLLTNTITIPITVTTGGTYDVTAIPATSSNGVTFRGVGVLTPASTVITLYASAGTPLLQGNFIYAITVGGTTCQPVVSYLPPPLPSIFTINCGTSAQQTGLFQAGTLLTAASTIKISVSPATLGTYTITTDTLNGVSYRATGNFTTVFTQNVDLIANPTLNLPVASGTVLHKIYGGTAICNNVSVSYTAASGNTGFIKVNIDGGGVTTFNVNAKAVLSTGFGFDITVSGKNSASSLENIQLSVTTPTVAPQPNILYSADGFTALVDAFYKTPLDFNYEAITGGNNSVNPFTIKFTSITATRAVGIFYGIMRDNIGTGTMTKVFANGEFDVPF